ncbi:hypothetical protein J6590_028387 [Homalodisca vitripennis]|nr:hypothetical protein J6590_028387 [Homalodisca vitripennis]
MGASEKETRVVGAVNELPDSAYSLSNDNFIPLKTSGRCYRWITRLYIFLCRSDDHLIPLSEAHIAATENEKRVVDAIDGLPDSTYSFAAHIAATENEKRVVDAIDGLPDSTYSFAVKLILVPQRMRNEWWMLWVDYLTSHIPLQNEKRVVDALDGLPDSTYSFAETVVMLGGLPDSYPAVDDHFIPLSEAHIAASENEKRVVDAVGGLPDFAYYLLVEAHIAASENKTRVVDTVGALSGSEST